jgi:protein phosphatase
VSVPDSREYTSPGDNLPVRIDIFGMTHPGKVRPNNEDQFFVASLRKSMRVGQTSLQDLSMFARLRDSSAHLLVVADGVGGVAGGELASGTAVETLASHIVETVGCCYNLDVDKEHEFLDHLEAAVERSHQRVLERHASDGRRPATTLTMVALV